MSFVVNVFIIREVMDYIVIKIMYAVKKEKKNLLLEVEVSLFLLLHLAINLLRGGEIYFILSNK